MADIMISVSAFDDSYSSNLIKAFKSLTAREAYIYGYIDSYKLQDEFKFIKSKDTNEKNFYIDNRPSRVEILLNKLRAALSLMDCKEITFFKNYSYFFNKYDALVMFKVMKNGNVYKFSLLTIIDVYNNDMESIIERKQLLEQRDKRNKNLSPGLLIISNSKEKEFEKSTIEDYIKTDLKMKNLRTEIEKIIKKGTIIQ